MKPLYSILILLFFFSFSFCYKKNLVSTTKASLCPSPKRIITLNYNLAFDLFPPYYVQFDAINPSNQQQLWCIWPDGKIQNYKTRQYLIWHVTGSSHCQFPPCYIHSLSLRNDTSDTYSHYNWNITKKLSCGKDTFNTITYNFNDKGNDLTYSLGGDPNYIAQIEITYGYTPPIFVFQ